MLMISFTFSSVKFKACAIAAVALLLFGKVGDHAVGREEEPGDGRGVL